MSKTPERITTRALVAKRGELADRSAASGSGHQCTARRTRLKVLGFPEVVDSLQDRKAIPLLSTAVLAEYRAILLHPVIVAKFANLTARRVELALHRLRYVGDVYPNIRVRFELERDPRDGMFVELAIAGQATHLITMDADLLSLLTARTNAGKRFRRRLPQLIVQTPQSFIETWGQASGYR